MSMTDKFADRLRAMSDDDLRSLFKEHAAAAGGNYYKPVYRQRKHSFLTDPEFVVLAAEYDLREKERKAAAQRRGEEQRQQEQAAEQQRLQQRKQQQRELKAMRARLRAAGDAELAAMDSAAATAFELTEVRKEIKRRAQKPTRRAAHQTAEAFRAFCAGLGAMSDEQLLAWGPTGASAKQVKAVIKELENRSAILAQRKQALRRFVNRRSRIVEEIPPRVVEGRRRAITDARSNPDEGDEA
jgi:hypothetical protein